MADQSFKTAPDGERLFYLGGPWSRPYIVPDSDTEHRLHRKVLWSLRIMLGLMIVGQPFLLRGPFVNSSYQFFSYLAVVVVIFWLGRRMVLMPDLRRLARAPAKLPLRSFYGEMAAKHSAIALSLGTGGSALFLAGGTYGFFSGQMPDGIAVFSIAFFGACAFAWGYGLWTKTLGSSDTAQA